MSNLYPNQRGINQAAEDCTEKPIPVSVTIEPYCLDFLYDMGKTRSFHFREAIRDYIRVHGYKDETP